MCGSDSFLNSAPDHIVLPRPQQHGGPITMKLEEDSESRLDEMFAQLDLHPGDLKSGLEELIETHLRNRLAKFLPVATELDTLINDAFPLPKKKGKNQANSTSKGERGEKEGKQY